MNSARIFRELSAALEQASIPYMVVGSFASNLHGMGRGTQDIDILISAGAEQIRTLLRNLPESTYYFDLDTALEACRRKSMFNVLDMNEGWKVDLIFQKPSPYHAQAFQRRMPAEIEKVPLMAATAEDTIVSKLEWAKLSDSSRQLEDVAGILKVQGNSLDRQYIDKWVHELGLDSQWERARVLAAFE